MSLTLVLMLCGISILPTAGTLAWALLRLYRAHRVRADAAVMLMARHNAVTECVRLVKHGLCVFGILAPLLALPWPSTKVRDFCLAAVCVLLGATSAWSLWGMVKFIRLRERERVTLRPKL